jgi:hypothetical protein
MPKTFVVTSRLNIEDIATIAAFMSQNKIYVRSRTDPVSYGIDMIAEIIRDNHPSLTFSVSEAMNFLEDVGVSCVKGNRGARELAKQLQYNELSQYGDNVDAYTSNHDSANPTKDEILSTEDKEMIERRRKEELEKQLDSFRNITGLDMEE